MLDDLLYQLVECNRQIQPAEWRRNEVRGAAHCDENRKQTADLTRLDRDLRDGAFVLLRLVSELKDPHLDYLTLFTRVFEREVFARIQAFPRRL